MHVCQGFYAFIHTVDVSFYRCAVHYGIYIQDVTGGTDQTSGECSLGQTIPI